jgi:hypothetical protein
MPFRSQAALSSGVATPQLLDLALQIARSGLCGLELVAITCCSFV